MDSSHLNEMLGRRIRWLREKAGLTQADISEKLGFKDRQTLSAIEAGQRKVSADELLRFIEVLGVDFDFLTDPFLLVEDPRFSWRAKDAPATLDAFEEKVRPVVGLFRQLGRDLGESSPALMPQLPLDTSHRFEDASLAAEKLAVEWRLGNIPAKRLFTTAEEKLGLLVLMIDAPAEVSGAALALTDFPVILVNRKEPECRRNYDFAHELFHILTWHAMPPPERDVFNPSGYKAKRVEQLAESFAAALLMPERTVRELVERRPENADMHDWVRTSASVLSVSGTAFYYRLKNLGLLKDGDGWMEPERLVRPDDAPKPKLYSRRFMERLHAGIGRGLVSVRRTARLLDVTIDDLADLFRDHGLEPPFDL